MSHHSSDMPLRGLDLAKLAVRQENKYDLSNVKQELTYCSAGHECSSEIQGIYSDYAISFLCKKCQERWAVCCKCKSNTQHLYNRKAIRSHKSKQHKNLSEMPLKRKIDHTYCEPTIVEHPQAASSEGDYSTLAYHDNDDDFVPMDVRYSFAMDEPHQSFALCASSSIHFHKIPTHSALGFAHEGCTRFFQFCESRGPQTSFAEAAVEFLTAQCLMNTSLTNADLRMTALVPQEFRNMLVEYAYLCFRNGKKNRKLLCGILQKLHTSGMQDGWKCCQTAIKEEVHDPARPSWLDSSDFIHSYISQPFCPTKITDGAHQFSLGFPMTENKIRSMLIEGKFSIINNLPYPEVKDDIEDHAYVSLEDCIRHALAFAKCKMQVIDPFPDDYQTKMKWMFAEQDYPTNESFSPTVSEPSRTKHAYEIWQDLGAPGVNIGYLYFWSDDADTNSQSMQGRAKVWVKSMTIGAPTDCGNLVENTYPVAIGLKGVSHERVEEKHSQGLLRLRSDKLEPFFVGDINRLVKCRFGVFANFGDQPEKRSSNGLALGSSLYGGRSFVSACHKLLYPKLKACASCLKQMRRCFQNGQFTRPIPHCQQCLNWDVLNTNNDLALVPLPEDYPYEGLERKSQPPLTVPGYINRVVTKDGKRYIKPFEVTYEGLHTAIREAHIGYRDHNWSAKIARAYLSVEVFNDETINTFLEYAERATAYKLLVEDQDKPGAILDPVFKQDLENAYAEHPELFGVMPVPSLHTRPGVSLKSHIEAIMHILALGVSKRSTRQIQESLKATKRNKAFIDVTAKTLQPLIEWKLEWLKLMPYTGGKFHGWNATQWLAFVRVMPWFYQNVERTSKDALEVVELPSENSQKVWLKKHNLHWLKIRGLDTKGSAPELKDRVANYMRKPDAPPILPEVALPLGEIQYLVNSLYDMMECLLGKSVSVETISKAGNAIRIFLSSFDDLDSKVPGKKKKEPSVISAYNFCCLLNLPEVMRTYGPLRHNWEGKYQGEALLPFVKEQHTQGIRTNWASNLLKNVLRERTFSVLLQQSPEAVGNSGAFSKSLNSMQELNACKSYLRSYKCIAEVNAAFATVQSHGRMPLSILLARDRDSDNPVKLFALVHSYDEVVEIVMVEGTVGTVSSMVKFGQHYYRFRLVPTDKSLALTEATTCFGTPVFEFAMLLPVLDNEESSVGMFAVVSHNWARLGPHNSLADLVA